MDFKRLSHAIAVLWIAGAGAALLPAQNYSLFETYDILSKNDGLPCNPQRGASDGYYNSGCCGSPGNRSCFFTGCTAPDSNDLRWNSYDSKLLCNLPAVLPELPPSLILPAAKPAVRDFRFFVTSDLHFYRVNYDFLAQVTHPSRLNQMHNDSKALGKPYSAVIIPGDITTGAKEQRVAAFRTLWERGTLPGSSIDLPVFPGLGNHDASAKGDFGSEATDARRIWDYIDARMRFTNIDTSITGCLIGIDPLCFGFGSLAGSHNYSWDWHGVHMVMLHTWAGDTDRSYTPPLGMDGMNWLKRDLEHFVGTSGRPVILFQHYPLRTADFNPDYYPTTGKTAFLQLIRPYNVIGLFTGHTHGLAMTGNTTAVNQPAGSSVSGPGTVLDSFNDGAAGDCHDDNCVGATSNFLSVQVTDKYLDVTAYSWQHILPTYVDANMSMGPSSDKGVCRKRIANRYTDISPEVGVTFNGNHLTVTNTSGTAIPGAIVIRFGATALNSWDFLDSCSSSGRPFLVATEGGLAAGASVTIPYSAASTPSTYTVYRIGDGLSSSNDAPVVGPNASTIEITTLSGDAVPFTFQVDPYTSGNTRQWLNVAANRNTTPATFTMKASDPMPNDQPTASFTITPANLNIAPLKVNVTLEPATLKLLTSSAGAKFLYDGDDQPLPFTANVVPGSQHKLDVPSPQSPSAGVRLTFKNWSNQAESLQNLTVPFGTTTLTANFDTLYSIFTAVSPAGTGSITGSATFVAQGSPISISATPRTGFKFVNFTGTRTSSTTPLNFNSAQPETITANFEPNGAPLLYAAQSGAASGAGDTRTLPIVIRNSGPGGAVNSRIDSVTNISVISGTGVVTPILPAPLTTGTLIVGASAPANLQFNWPATATRVRMTINFSANGGAYQGSTTLNLFR